MLWLLAALVVGRPATTSPLDELTAVQTHYKSLKQITYTIVRHVADNPKLKDLADRVRWKPHHFEVNPIPYKDSPGTLGSQLICDDGLIEVLAPLTGMSQEQFDPGPDRIGAWEGRGGLLLVWLMGGKSWDLMVKPHEGLSLQYLAGDRTNWHDHDVHEIVLSRKIGPIEDKLSLFVSPKDDALVGSERVSGGLTTWEEYMDSDEG